MPEHTKTKHIKALAERIEAVRFEDDQLILLDQTRLPTDKVFLHLDKVEDVWAAIKRLSVRGAPAIGGAAAFGLYLGIRDIPNETSTEAFIEKLLEMRDYLATSRPTAVNLFWALNRLVSVAQTHVHLDIRALKGRLLAEAHAIKTEDEAMCRAIGEHALTLFTGVDSVLTHCNAGSLATMGVGTALAPIYLAAERGTSIHVFADETRPLLQGARITAWELRQAGLPVTLITDGMPATVMRQGRIQAVIVGTDRVAANGDVANKIGTYGVAILAKEHGIPFYVAAPSSTVDFATPTGETIEIELRDAAEIRSFAQQATAPHDVDVYNPAFDVTPAKYVTAIITEKGIVTAPYETNLREVLGR